MSRKTYIGTIITPYRVIATNDTHARRLIVDALLSDIEDSNIEIDIEELNE